MESRSIVPESVTRDLGRLKEATEKVVGSVFFGSMLKMMRESTIRGALGHGGRGEEVFAGQLHGIFAERMGARAHGGIADVLYAKLERQQRQLSGRRADLRSDPPNPYATSTGAETLGGARQRTSGPTSIPCSNVGAQGAHRAWSAIA